MVKVLFVCMGNICRSPMAEGVFRHQVESAGLAAHFEIDSAGTHSYHIGAQPDSRGQETALRRGVDLSGLRGRQIQNEDFERFDYVIAMDEDNRSLLVSRNAATEYESRIRLFLEFAPYLELKEVPDPYYGSAGGFEQVMDMVEEASRGLLEAIRREHRLD